MHVNLCCIISMILVHMVSVCHMLFTYSSHEFHTHTPSSVMKALFACFLAEKSVSSLWSYLWPKVFARGWHGKYSPSWEYPCSIWSGHCQLVFTICGFSKLFVNLTLVSFKLSNQEYIYIYLIVYKVVLTWKAKQVNEETSKKEKTWTYY